MSEESGKRNFRQYLRRTMTLETRIMKVQMNWELTKRLTPFRALCSIRKFNHILRMLHNELMLEYEKGYWEKY